MAPRARRAIAGLTMIEVLVATVILSAVVAMSSWLVWSASDHVSTAEIELQLENQAREAVQVIAKELRQSRIETVIKLDPASIKPDASNMASVTPPGLKDSVTIPNPKPGEAFNAIRFRVPGNTMDLTTLNAYYDPTDKTKQNNFNMQKFKTSEDSAWTYEIMYYWEIDNTHIRNEGVLGSGPNGYIPNGVDDNGNGLVDEGLVRKIESWYDANGNLDIKLGRKISTLVRHVKFDAKDGLGGLKFTVLSSDATGKTYTAGSSKSIQVSLTLQKRDPRFPKLENRLIERTATAIVDLRN